jgi:hypothetical protein
VVTCRLFIRSFGHLLKSSRCNRKGKRKEQSIGQSLQSGVIARDPDVWALIFCDVASSVGIDPTGSDCAGFVVLASDKINNITFRLQQTQYRGCPVVQILASHPLVFCFSSPFKRFRTWYGECRDGRDLPIPPDSTFREWIKQTSFTNPPSTT